MRLVTVLLMGLAPGLALSQSRYHPDLLHVHPYDTLQKYSYLIVSYRRDRLHNEDTVPMGASTGFFLRQDKKLYLISASHVFTNCDLYTAHKRADTPVAIKVWYQDTLGRTVNQMLPLPKNKTNNSCKMAYVAPDADTLDVSGYFKDGQLSSVERLMPDYQEYSPLSPGDTVVAYGYSRETQDTNDIEKAPNLAPVGYIAHGREMPDEVKDSGINQRFAFYYYAIAPGLPKGVSGAPVFRVSAEGTGKPPVEFLGIQSGTKGSSKLSLIVQGYVLYFLYHLNQLK